MDKIQRQILKNQVEIMGCQVHLLLKIVPETTPLQQQALIESIDKTGEMLNPTKENPDEKFGKDFTDELMEETRE